MQEITQQRFDQAAGLLGEKKYDQAEKVLRYLLAEEPQIAEAHRLLGLVLHKQASWGSNQHQPMADVQRLKEARAEVETAIGMSPGHAPSFCLLTNILLDLGNLQGAGTAADEAIRLNPQDAATYAVRASVWARRGLLGKAHEAVNQGLHLDSADIGCLSVRAEILMRQKRFMQARTCLQEAAARYPDEPIFHRQLGELGMRMGSAQAARPHLEETLRRDPNDARTRGHVRTIECVQQNAARRFNDRWFKKVVAGITCVLIILWILRHVLFRLH